MKNIFNLLFVRFRKSNIVILIFVAALSLFLYDQLNAPEFKTFAIVFGSLALLFIIVGQIVWIIQRNRNKN